MNLYIERYINQQNSLNHCRSTNIVFSLKIKSNVPQLQQFYQWMSYNNEPSNTSNSAWGGLYWQTDVRTVYNRRPCRLAAAAKTTTHKHDWRRSLQFFATVFYVDPRDRARGVLDSFNTTAHAHHILRGEGSRTQVYDGKAYAVLPQLHSLTRRLVAGSLRSRNVRKNAKFNFKRRQPLSVHVSV